MNFSWAESWTSALRPRILALRIAAYLCEKGSLSEKSAIYVFTYSEDRYGAALAPEGIRGLVVGPAGRMMLPSVNIQQYLEQVNRYRGIWTKFALFLTETPQIAHRINALHEAGLWKAPALIGSEFETNTSPRHSLEKRTG